MCHTVQALKKKWWFFKFLDKILKNHPFCLDLETSLIIVPIIWKNLIFLPFLRNHWLLLLFLHYFLLFRTLSCTLLIFFWFFGFCFIICKYILVLHWGLALSEAQSCWYKLFKSILLWCWQQIIYTKLTLVEICNNIFCCPTFQ